ncbi:hypothetical protein EON67_00480 [archaeon]|nr:MAG: hypothetical protein EON67_00480 [archaeon]
MLVRNAHTHARTLVQVAHTHARINMAHVASCLHSSRAARARIASPCIAGARGPPRAAVALHPTAAAFASFHTCTPSRNAGFDLRMGDSTRAVVDTARAFAKEVIAPASRALDASGEWPSHVFQQAWQAGLVNMHVPTTYGGLGCGLLDGVCVAEELAWADAGVMTAIEINTVAEVPVMLAGTEEQKRSYLGRMIAEPLQAAYCVTEPGVWRRTQCGRARFLCA